MDKIQIVRGIVFRFICSRPVLIVCILLVAAALIVYWQTLDFDFTNYDDGSYVTNNINVRNGLTVQGVRWALTTGYESTWQPMVWLSYMVDATVYGMDPNGFHLTNLIFHLLNTLLLFLLLNRVTKAIWKSAFVAAVFAVHPLHVESVAWIAERKDVLSSFFWMLAMLAYVRYVESPKLCRYLMIVIAMALGLLSKPLVVTLPIALLLLDYWPLRRFEEIRMAGRTWRKQMLRLLFEKTPLFALAAVSSIITYVVQHSGGAVSSFEQVPFGIRMANAAVSYAVYIQKTFWPSNLAVIYPHPVNTLPTWLVAASYLSLVAATVIVIRLARKRPYIAVGWLWYIITMLPMIGLIQFGMHGMADRFMYIPMIGLSIAVAWGVPSLFGRTSIQDTSAVQNAEPIRIGLSGAAVLTLLAYTFCAHIQTGHWRDSESLFRHALSATHRNYVAHNQLASALETKGDIGGAIQHYHAALSIHQDFPDAHGNLGGLLLMQGQTDAAISHFATVVRLQPHDYKARYNLGLALEASGQLDEAIREYREAVRLSPYHTGAIGSIGNVLLKQGKIDEAILQYEEVLNIDPTDEVARRNLAVALDERQQGVSPRTTSEAQTGKTDVEDAQRQNQEVLALIRAGRLDEAVDRSNAAIQAEPDFADGYCNLGVALASQGKIDEAIVQYKKALEVDSRLVEAHANLGAALGSKGLLDSAIQHLSEAVRIKPDNAEVHANLSIAFFQKGNYIKAWEEVHLCRKYGGTPHPAFIEDLSAKMLDPSL